MNQIEKVARAFHALWNLVQYHKSGGHSGSGSDRTLANALRELAAIAAMPVQAEPVAWKNYADDGDWWLTDDREPADSCEYSIPLYAFPTPPAGGSDAEWANDFRGTE